MEHLRRGEGEGEDGDVVLLAVGLGGAGDGFSGLGADGLGAVEAEELAGGGLGFDYAVGEEGEPVAGSEADGGFSSNGVGSNAERQAGVERDFFAVAVRREMAGIGEG